MSRLPAIILAVLCLHPLVCVQGQIHEPLLTRVKDVLALPVAEAQTKTRQVKLRGVIVDVSASRDELSLHDGEASISVTAAPTVSVPQPGTEIEVEGTVFSEAHLDRSRSRTRVSLSKLTALGMKSLPAATSTGVEEAASFKQLDQWVSVEGTVTQVRSSMSLFTIQLVSKAAVCNVLVRDWPREELPHDWIGGKVRVIGVNRPYLPGNSFLAMIAPSREQVTVLSKGVSDPFDAPATTIAGLKSAASDTNERYKVTGTLLGATNGNVFYARGDDGGAFSFYMLHPIDEDKSGRFSTPIIMPEVKPGDAIEVVGMKARYELGLHMNFCVVRVLRHVGEPSAIPVPIAAINEGVHVHDLVETHGRLLSVDDVLIAPGRYRTTMKLDDDGQQIVAFLDAPARGALKDLTVDHQLQVHGIVSGPPHFQQIRLWIRSPKDVQSLGIAMPVVERRLWTGLGIVSVVMIMFAGWAFMLRRSRTVVREINASLEARVAERTAELAAAKDELDRALVQERELGELKTRFVSMVSHEFRTPLGVTMSAVELLRHFGDRITPEKRIELHEDIHSSTLQMSGLMEQVLLLGRAEAGKLAWQPATLDLPELCQKLSDEMRSSTSQRCPVNFTSEGEFDGAIMDPMMLRHILNNLLSNAVKYSPEGSTVDFRLRREGNDAVFIVADHGIGIPTADQERLFQAFHRASNVGDIQGTGLGLLLAKRCVDLHRGSIALQSKEGTGTTFTVRLPLSQA